MIQSNHVNERPRYSTFLNLNKKGKLFLSSHLFLFKRVPTFIKAATFVYFDVHLWLATDMLPYQSTQ